MPEFYDDGNCFVCGEKNALGLKITFYPDNEGKGTRAEVVFPDHFQGWQKVVHGGLITTVLDEMLIKAAWQKGFTCVTAEITVKFLSPVRTGIPYTIFGRFTGERGRMVYAESQLLDEKERVLARASGKLFKTDASIIDGT